MGNRAAFGRPGVLNRLDRWWYAKDKSARTNVVLCLVIGSVALWLFVAALARDGSRPPGRANAARPSAAARSVPPPFPFPAGLSAAGRPGDVPAPVTTTTTPTTSVVAGPTVAPPPQAATTGTTVPEVSTATSSPPPPPATTEPTSEVIFTEPPAAPPAPPTTPHTTAVPVSTTSAPPTTVHATTTTTARLIPALPFDLPLVP